MFDVVVVVVVVVDGSMTSAPIDVEMNMAPVRRMIHVVNIE